MSFHLHRLSNKLSRTKLPTSTYQSHYSFQAKRNSKEEVFCPKVQTDDQSPQQLVDPSPIVYSNWRRMANLPKYEYPLFGEFWVRLAILLTYPAFMYYDALTKPDLDVETAQASTKWGVKEFQETLDMPYED